ncbi:MAG: relaxase/mobilization nuclease domain-containing protein [Lachnospiraceae bacterium]|nr:relaxase/mobilization nuclease domain-containing protein [Lachnospiraceae bacterium]
MAITKIQYLNEAHTGNPAVHLKNALAYIQNPEKTGENVLVGSINCLPETAFDQMMDTKVTFGKTDKRQGYHIIISFAPGEATKEQALDIVGRFAKEYLKDNYEAVYAVHNDKKHMHGHIVFNSVSFATGIKHEYKKGDWKYRMQPITNRLCREYGLSIVPAEYAKKPKNLNRKEWEREQSFRNMILDDAIFCQEQAGSFEHFVFLMKRIGYQFEYGKYLSVRVPGGKWYHELDKLDERFMEEKFYLYVDMPFRIPKFVVDNRVIYRKATTSFQMKYYRRIYQARMVEQRRFDKHSAYLAKELARMKQLQEQYLFLVNNDIKTLEGLVTYKVLKELDVERISERQQELYQQNRARKRSCKTEADIRDFQMWHMGVQEELDGLKAEKKAISRNLKIANGCLEEYKRFSPLDYSTLEEELRWKVEVPEYPYTVHEKEVEPVSGDVIANVAEELVDVDVTDAPDVVAVEPNDVTDKREALSVEDEVPVQEDDIVLPVRDYVDDLSEVSEPVTDESMVEELELAEYELEKCLEKKHISYEEYKRMTPLEKAQNCGFNQIRSRQTVQNIVMLKFMDMEHTADVDELLEETEKLYQGMCELVAQTRAEEILEETKRLGVPFEYWTIVQKAEALQFQLDNNAYNVKLYLAVCKACGVDTSDEDKVFADYQAVYEKTVDMQTEQRFERRDGGRGGA